MRCKHCDYPLWNIRARQCPECGQAFRPSEFRFATNAVRFCCPHCGQDYYGTGVDGHLTPRLFDCVGCGRRVDMDEMVLQPTEGVDERLTKAECNPWLDQDRRFLSRWFGTLFRGACMPSWLLRVTPVESDVGQAWAFAVFSMVSFAVVMILPVLAFAVLIAALGGGGAGGGLLGLGIVSVLVQGLVSALLLALWVVTTHGMLRLGGKTAGGLGRTAQALCYTCGPQLVLLVPCLGAYFGWIGSLWWVVVAGVALATAQKVRGGRAALAVSVLPAVCVVLVGALVLWGIAGSVGAVHSARAAVGLRISAFQRPMQLAMEAGVWPGHIAEYLPDNSIAPGESLDIYDFTAAMSNTAAADCVVGSVDLAAWRDLTPESQRQEIQLAVSALPDDTVAYRVGDFVFTYPGVDPMGSGHGLWLVVEAWDPSIPQQPSQGLVSVVSDDGTVRSFPRNLVGPELRRQNQLRAAHGLPPLPDPFSVRSDRPATAGESDEPG